MIGWRSRGSTSFLPGRQIGFVSHDFPVRSDAVRRFPGSSKLEMCSLKSKHAWFGFSGWTLETSNLRFSSNWVRFAHLASGRATPHTTTAFAHIPQSPQV
jgi:hypothetical protein